MNSSSTRKSSPTGFGTPDPFIGVLIPTRGLIFTRALIALLGEVQKHAHAFFFTHDLPLPDSRNKLVESAEESGLPLTHYLLLDDDVVIPKGGLQKMLEADKPIVFIDYPMHWMGDKMHYGTASYDPWKEGMDVKESKIAWAGLGCVLIKREVFSKLKKPYFRKGGMLFDRGKDGKLILYGMGGGDGGEDFEFYQDARREGYDPVQIYDVTATHAKVMKHVGIIQPGKYVTPHDIHYAEKIERPFK